MKMSRSLEVNNTKKVDSSCELQLHSLEFWLKLIY